MSITSDRSQTTSGLEAFGSSAAKASAQTDTCHGPLKWHPSKAPKRNTRTIFFCLIIFHFCVILHFVFLCRTRRARVLPKMQSKRFKDAFSKLEMRKLQYCYFFFITFVSVLQDL